MSRNNYEMSADACANVSGCLCKCQRMLVITIYNMSNASHWYLVAKSDQDHQGSQREQLRILVTF